MGNSLKAAGATHLDSQMKSQKLSGAKPNANCYDPGGDSMVSASRLGSASGKRVRVRVRALFSFDGQDSRDLSFKKGDYMEAIGNLDEPWMRVRHLRSKKIGYIPAIYVVKDDGSPESLDAWFNIGRREANRLLLMMGNPVGTYLIRPSSAAQSYALSIRHQNPSLDMWYVRHYKIKKDDNGYYFIVTQRQANIRKTATMEELIKHYENNSGLCCRLKKPCPRDYRPPVQFRDIEVNRKSIIMSRKLGGGAFGDVWLAKWNNAVEVAVKTMKPGAMSVERFIQEAKIMHRLNHPRIVQILGVCTTESPTYIITELMVNGALLDYLHIDKGRALKLNDMIDMMAQITEGMAYLESMQFVHRDLRAANILVGEMNDVKVADFGLAHITENGDEVYKGNEATKFPVKWTAPEAQISKRFSIKSDVWSFGILMYEIVTYGRTPYPGINAKAIYTMVQNGYRMPNPHQTGEENIVCPPELYEIMLECWNLCPDGRPTFNHLNNVFDDWSISTEGQYIET